MAEVSRLLSVRLRGFKTFAKPTELTFEPGVTVIIGPNGSGKSNIADAVLWVLGEQSPGNLRGRSMQDVIFSGPDGRRSSAVAEVSLVFDNRNGFLPIETGEVELTRRLERDGASEYRINGSSCRLLDVQDLVGGLGIGREMHSVISQGKVEALLNSTPEARRAMVEEAAGLGRFKKRRERAQAKLEKTRLNLVRMADVEREVKNALRPLRQQAAAAGRFTEAKEEWAQEKARLLLAQITSVRSVADRTTTEAEALRRKRSGLESELAGIRRERVTEEDRFAVALQERERLGAVYHRLAVEAEQVQGRATSLRQRLARMEAELERARRRKEAGRLEAESLERRLSLVTARTSDEARLERVSQWGLLLRSGLEAAVAEFRGATAAEDELKDAVFGIEAARSRAIQDREFLRREVEARTRVDEELAALSAEVEARTAALQAEAAEHDQAVQTAERGLEAAEARARAAVADWEKARAGAAAATQEQAGLAEALRGIEAREAVLEDLVLRREGTPAGVRDLMSRIPGCQLLAEVMVVEPGYERAVAAALGPLAQAVLLGAPEHLQLVLEGDDILEIVVAGESQGSALDPGAVPAGSLDLWRVVAAPAQVIAVLRGLVPPTAIVKEDVRFSVSDVSASREGFRLVNRRGEMIESGVHVARRREIGVETLLQARNELQAVAVERQALLERSEQAQSATRTAAAELGRAERLVAEAQETLAAEKRALAGFAAEKDLHARRLEEAVRRGTEVRARQERESGLAEQMLVRLREVSEGISARESELESTRGELRAVQGRIGRLRDNATFLEQKKAQAALVEVRLKERCRAQQGERDRLLSQRDAAAVAVELWQTRTHFLDGYVPLLADLLKLTERLAERSGAVRSGFESQLEVARTSAEGAARVMRDAAGSESGLQQEYDIIGSRLAELQVDMALQEERRALLEEELAELRRKHLKPRSLSAADVAGANLDLLEAAEERAARRLERLGPVNPLAEQECAELEGRASFLAEQRRDLEGSLAQLREVVADLDQHIDRSFIEMFEAVKENFSAVIATVFPGAKGNLKLTEGPPALPASAEEGMPGELEEILVEETRPPTRGIGLEVKLPNKSPRSLSLLSGGEKAMAAIAFLFSLFLARPCPFYILDEVEASLDDINIRRFLSLVRRYRERTQFVIITHQRQTMEVADTLYGVTLEGDGTSHILSRRLSAAKTLATKGA
jgi:chromosome segregation protein